MGRAQDCSGGHYFMFPGGPSTVLVCTPWSQMAHRLILGRTFLGPSTEGQGVGAAVRNLWIKTPLAIFYL